MVRIWILSQDDIAHFQCIRYKRDELGLRLAYFNCGAAASYFLGPLFASGVFATMDKKLGYAAWRYWSWPLLAISWPEHPSRWLFFIEGGLTCIIAIASFYTTPDFPTTPASWLTVDERLLAQTRMEEDWSNIEHKSAQRLGLVSALTDWTVWWLAIAGFFLLVGASFGLFFPTIAATMGYSPTVTLLLCAPPSFIGVTTSFFVMRSVHSNLVTLFIIWLSATDIPMLLGIGSGISSVQFQWAS